MVVGKQDETICLALVVKLRRKLLKNCKVAGATLASEVLIFQRRHVSQVRLLDSVMLPFDFSIDVLGMSNLLVCSQYAENQ